MARETSLIEIYRDGCWTPAAELIASGPERSRVEYLSSYVFGNDPWPIALHLPVGFAPAAWQGAQDDVDTMLDTRAPPFLYDLVPQGKGRRYLLQLLRLGDADHQVVPLLNAGAFNPIGCLRIDRAVAFFAEHAAHNPDRLGPDGLALADIEVRSEEFLEHLSLHGMLAAGTTGVQGVAPKFLLSQNVEGRWFADLALPDAKARAHWLLKLPRGRSADDLAVLRNEAAYLHLARAAGLRALPEEGVIRRGDMLFVRRFDRQVLPGGGVARLHQESLASVAGLQGFAPASSLNHLLLALRRVASDPLAETVEFLKRDVLNQALRNTDNHARNTAVQRLPDGRIQLTPVFDFAPMFMDPDVIPRSLHWVDGDGRRLDTWQAVLDGLDLPAAHRRAVTQALRAFADTVGQLPGMARDCGVEESVLSQCLLSIAKQADQLATLQD